MTRLGWTTSAAPDNDVAFFQAGGMIVGLWSRDQLAEDSGVEDGGGWGGVTLAHNVGSSAEADVVIAEAEAAGRPSVGGRPQPVWTLAADGSITLAR